MTNSEGKKEKGRGKGQGKGKGKGKWKGNLGNQKFHPSAYLQKNQLVYKYHEAITILLKNNVIILTGGNGKGKGKGRGEQR